MSQFAEKIIRWQRRAGRHDLPWQNSRDAYRIWVAEIMLQQTQVSTVIAYFARFMARFPDVAALASASLDEVMPYWAGLGYYARARHLHQAALQIRDKCNGVFPRDFEEVWALPGVGRSTASAICAFAHGDARPILDGNVKRVFARYFGMAGDVRAKAVENEMWLVAEREKPAKNIEAYIQGQMDLGASLCARAAPRCPLCPLQNECVAHQTGRTHALPGRGPKKIRPHRKIQMLVMVSANEVLIERRPPTGIWGGLWSLPEIAIDADARAMAKSRFGVTLARGRRPLAQTPIGHGFTHFSLTIYPVVIAVGRCDATLKEPGTIWLNLDDVSGAALPAPSRKILRQLQRPLF